MAVTDVLDRAQAWLKAANERGINVTDDNGYLAVISDLAAEVTKLREQVSESIADMRELRDELRATRIQWEYPTVFVQTRTRRMNQLME